MPIPEADAISIFSVDEPRATETPLIVEVPHAGVYVDPESLAQCTAPGKSIGQDADLYVSDLFKAAPDYGAHFIYSHMSRYVCDLNRSEDDLDAHTTPGGTVASSPHGVVWRKTTEGRPALVAPLTRTEVERRLELVYRPYHQALYNLVQKKRDKFGFVILLCGHSMPSFGRLGERRADVVPGSRGHTTAAAAVLQAAEKTAAASRYDLSHDSPYRGGFTTGHYGSPTFHIHAMQIELARRLYMDEQSLSKLGDEFQRCKNFCNTLLSSLSDLRLR
jgi:N-formylglutamate deformylase